MEFLGNVSTGASGTSPTHRGDGNLLRNLDITQLTQVQNLGGGEANLGYPLFGQDGAGNKQIGQSSLLGLLRISPGGRLTLTSGTPVTTSDVTGTSLYYTPYIHDAIVLWDGTRWTCINGASTSIALGTLVPGQAYDIFGYASGSLMQIEKLEWKNATCTISNASPGVVTWNSHGLATGGTVTFTTTGGLPTGLSANTVYYVTVLTANTFKLSTSLVNLNAGTFINTSSAGSGTHTAHAPNARQTGISIQDGRYCKTGDKTRLYLGTVLASSTTQVTDSITYRGIWNMYNRVPRELRKKDGTGSWTYGSTAWRTWDNSDTNRIEFVIGLQEEVVDIEFIAQSYSAVGASSNFGIGLDTPITPTEQSNNGGGGVAYYQQCTTKYAKAPAIGYHYATAMEYGYTTAITFYGSNSPGLYGTVRA